MNSKLHYFFTLLKFIIIIFLIVQPYNYFCNLTEKCNPFYFSSLIPRSEGKEPLEVTFKASNYIEGLELTPAIDSLKTVANRKNSMIYKVKNTSNKMIRFKSEFYLDPPQMEEYITKYECRCSKERKLKVGEESTIEMKFSFDKGIESQLYDLEGENRFTVGFKTSKISR